MSTTGHTSDPMSDHWEALAQAVRAERDAHRERAERAEARATAAEVASRVYRERAEREMRSLHQDNIRVRKRLQERAEKAEAKDTRSAGLLGHQSRTLTDAIASEVLRQKAVAWDEGKSAGLRQSDWEHGDTARMYIARNPYYATPPTTTEETTHE